MTTSTKAVLAFVGAVIIGGFIWGAYQYPKFVATGGSPSGSTFNTAKYAGAVSALANPGANGTSTSILNGDASDRIVTGVRIGCEVVGTSKVAYSGGGLAALLATLGTTSTAAPSSYPAGFNKIGGVDFTIPTTTPNSGLATTTIGTTGISTTSLIWTAGSYLTIFYNATNTAACTGGVDYIGS